MDLGKENWKFSEKDSALDVIKNTHDSWAEVKTSTFTGT